MVVLPFFNETCIKDDKNNYSKRKICISKVPHALNSEILLYYFGSFGELDNFFEIVPPKV
jgi:hypothetical protein